MRSVALWMVLFGFCEWFVWVGGVGLLEVLHSVGLGNVLWPGVC